MWIIYSIDGAAKRRDACNIALRQGVEILLEEEFFIVLISLDTFVQAFLDLRF